MKTAAPRFTVPATSVDTASMLVAEYEHLAGEVPFPPGPQQLPDLWKLIHELDEDKRPTALCLSGGGIRSATFCLGVLQGLAARCRLGSFRYLSTVSGGGYIGCFLARWRHEEARVKQSPGAVEDKLAGRQRTYAPTSDAAEMYGSERNHDPVRHLRAYSNYLSPVWGLSLDSLSLVAIFARNLLLNWFVWIPLLAGLVSLPRLYVSLLAFRPDFSLDVMIGLAVFAALLLAFGIAYIAADLPAEPPPARDVASRFVRCCFAPVAITAVVFSILSAWSTPPHWNGNVLYFVTGGMAAHVVGAAFGSLVWRKRRGLSPRVDARGVGAALAVLASGAVGGGLAWLVLQRAGSLHDDPQQALLLYATVAVPAMLGCFWLAMAVYAGALRRWTDEHDREWWSRASAWWLGASLFWVAAFGLVVYLPTWVLHKTTGSVPLGAQLGVSGAAVGIVTSLIGYWSKHGATLKKRADSLIAATGMRLLDLAAAAGILLVLLAICLGVSSVLAWAQREWAVPLDCLCRQSGIAYLGSLDADATAGWAPMAREHVRVLLETHWCWVLLLGAASTVLAVGVSWAIGVNTFSLHGMYGNRLVRSYLGATRAERHPHWFTGFDPADNLPLAALDQRDTPREQRRLFLVVNMALNLVKPSGRRLAWQQRKAASFTATPLRCGSDGLGYIETSRYADRHGLSIGRALTISGAAASPNMGYNSSGLVSIVMTWFNVRLGWWLPNPSWRAARRWRKRWAKPEPRIGLNALVDEALGLTTDDRESVFLSDGGHFENLGLYEMVRRRCHRIVVVDATCDPEYGYGDLLNAVRKVRVDLGIDIDLPNPLPSPSGAAGQRRRVVVGRIRYSQRDHNKAARDGWLYCIKPMLLHSESEPPDLRHYQAKSQRKGNVFPQQSTADQFFDETQFESYRLLGQLTACEVFREADDWPAEVRSARAPEEAGAAAAATPGGSGAPTTAAGSVPSAGVGGLAALGGAAHTIGQGATLAGALTLGVVGTLTLAPGSEISLSAADRKLLSDGIAVHAASAPEATLSMSPADRRLVARGLAIDPLPAGTLSLDPTDRGLLANGVTLRLGTPAALDELTQRLQALTEALRSTVSSGVAPQLAETVQKFSASLTALTSRLAQLPPPATPANGTTGGGDGSGSLDTSAVVAALAAAASAPLAAVARQLSGIQSAIAALPAAERAAFASLAAPLQAMAGELKSLNGNLAAMSLELPKLRGAIEDGTPRRNLRDSRPGEGR